MKLGEKMWTVKCQYESRRIPTGKLRLRGLDLRRHTSGLETHTRKLSLQHMKLGRSVQFVKRRILRNRAEGRLKRWRHRKERVKVPDGAKPPWSKEGRHPGHKGCSIFSASQGRRSWDHSHMTAYGFSEIGRWGRGWRKLGRCDRIIEQCWGPILIYKGTFVTLISLETTC